MSILIKTGYQPSFLLLHIFFVGVMLVLTFRTVYSARLQENMVVPASFLFIYSFFLFIQTMQSFKQYLLEFV